MFEVQSITFLPNGVQVTYLKKGAANSATI